MITFRMPYSYVCRATGVTIRQGEVFEVDEIHQLPNLRTAVLLKGFPYALNLSVELATEGLLQETPKLTCSL